MIYYFIIKIQSIKIKLTMHQVYIKCIDNARKIWILFDGFKTTFDFFVLTYIL